MPEYVDGFVIAVPAANLPAYRKMARIAGKVWKEYGALDYRECVGNDLQANFGKPFDKLTRLREDEVVVFSWITYKSKAHRNKVNAQVMEDPRIKDMCNGKNTPFDTKRMSYGGFKTIVSA